MTQLCFNTFNHCPWLGAPVPLREQIEAAAQAGFPLIGLDMISLDAAAAAGYGIDDVNRWLAAAGIGCGAIVCAGVLDERPATLAARAGVHARALGAAYVQVNMGVAGEAQQPVLEAACALVGPGVRLAIEYLPGTPLATIGETVALARSVGFERAGVMIDVWHHERGPDGWEDLAAVPAEAIAYVEFDDALPANGDLQQDMLDRRAFPGEGVFDLPRFAATIAATGYSGMVSVEILSAEWRKRDIGEFARRAFVSSRPYWPAT